MKFHQNRLENGLQIVAELNPSVQSCAIGFFVRTGSRDETAELSGVSHFLEHMAFKGTDTFSAADVNRFLTHLAVEKHVAASTQNQALAAVLFLDEKVLDEPLNRIEDVVRAKRPKRLPVVLTRDEARRILNELEGVHRTVGLLLYGSGLRLLEALRLRVKDVDFVRREFTVRQGKGDKDRRTMRASTVEAGLRRQIEISRGFHEADLERGFGSVELPHAFERKSPHAAFEFGWKYVFPAAGISTDPQSGVRRRHHIHESSVSKAIRRAVRRCDITKRVTAHTFRHSFATHLIEAGYGSSHK